MSNITLAAFSRRQTVVKKSILLVPRTFLSTTPGGERPLCAPDRPVGWKNAATPEDVSTAMIHYRSLFEELVQVPAAELKKIEDQHCGGKGHFTS